MSAAEQMNLNVTRWLRSLDKCMTPAPWGARRADHEPVRLTKWDPELETYSDIPGADLRKIAFLRNELPLIIAVIQAAETYVENDDTRHHTPTCECGVYFRALRDALVALGEGEAQ